MYTVYGLMQLGVGQCGSVWVNVDGCIWSNRPRVGQCGSVWVDVNGLIWLGVGQCGSVWVSVGGCIWSNMA